MRKPFILVLSLALALVVLGCSVEPKLTDKSVLSIDAWTKRNNPEISVEPLHSPPVPMTALMVPFQVTQDIPAADELGEQVTRILWQTWTRDRVFPKFLYESALLRATTPQAVAVARRKGVDLVVVGKITYLMSGGTQGDTAVSLTLDIIDVKTGERLWSMAHAGTMETGLTEDYIFFARKNRMPLDPIQAVVSTLAADMGGPVTKWNYGATPPPPAGPNPAPPPPAGSPAAPSHPVGP